MDGQDRVGHGRDYIYCIFGVERETRKARTGSDMKLKGSGVSDRPGELKGGSGKGL